MKDSRRISDSNLREPSYPKTGSGSVPSNVPAARVGRMPVDLRTSKAFVHLGATSFTNRDTVEGLLPGKALEHYQVVLGLSTATAVDRRTRARFRTAVSASLLPMLRPADIQESKLTSAA